MPAVILIAIVAVLGCSIIAGAIDRAPLPAPRPQRPVVYVRDDPAAGVTALDILRVCSLMDLRCELRGRRS